MNIIKVECPRCGAVLDVNEDFDTLCCRYCGYNLAPEGPSGSHHKAGGGVEPQQNTPATWLRAKLTRTTVYLVLTGILSIISTCGSWVWSFIDTRKLESVEEQVQDDMESLDCGSTHAIWLRTKLTRARNLITGYLVLTVILSIISTCGSYVWSFIDTIKLESVERQIQDDMESLDYESAYLKTKELEPSNSASSEKKEYWSQKESEYQDRIIELKRERDSADPNCIPAPESSEELEGRNYKKVAGLFTDAGFTNVKFEAEFLTIRVKTGRTRPGHSGYKDVRAPDDYWFTWTRGSVTKIEFGCLSSFTTEDHCKADEEIIIHYHGDGNEPISITVPERPEFDLPKVELPESVVVATPDDQS